MPATCIKTGEGPAVVLLHAGIADRTMWSEHLEPLADAGYRAVAVDLPGFGEAAVDPGEQAPWNDVEKTVEGARRTQTVFLQTSAGPRNAPADASQRDKP